MNCTSLSFYQQLKQQGTVGLTSSPPLFIVITVAFSKVHVCLKACQPLSCKSKSYGSNYKRYFLNHLWQLHVRGNHRKHSVHKPVNRQFRLITVNAGIKKELWVMFKSRSVPVTETSWESWSGTPGPTAPAQTESAWSFLSLWPPCWRPTSGASGLQTHRIQKRSFLTIF